MNIIKNGKNKLISFQITRTAQGMQLVVLIVNEI